MNLASIVDPHPDSAVALVTRGKEETYGSLRSQVAAARGGLVALGVRPGGRVGIAVGNNPTFVVAYLATLGIGAVAVPLNPLAPAPELQRQLAVTSCTTLVAGPSTATTVGQLDPAAVPALTNVVTSGGAGPLGSRSFDELLAAEPVPMVRREPDDLAALLFTSGTAGAPRAAMLTHGNLVANITQVQSLPSRRLAATDVTLGVIPLFHVFGLNVVLGASLHAGARVVLIERFDPASALEAIAVRGVTVVAGPPSMWAAWGALAGADPRAFDGVRLAVSGAAKLTVETAQLVEDRFDVHLDEGYGLTEAAPAVTATTGTGAPLGSVGMPLPGVEVRLVDGGGDDALVGDPGELWVRGPNVFPGYWEDPEATSAVLTADGWLRTGDLGVVGEDGALFLVDRAKDLIIVSGFNVFPAEVEDVLTEHPAVAEAAVVGVAHPHTGEAVKAYVVLEAGGSTDEDELISWAHARLARYKCPTKVMFVDELPHGPTGKVVRRQLP